ncbi:MAG TPA: hypothetical protein VMV34_06565, partial [Terriglobia bacterium]|nr:hypothetical protein [Terriglobia bacterium]
MMKRLLLIFSMIALLQDCAMNPAPAFGQYLGSTSQLTTSQSFTQTMTDLPTHLALTNMGQAGHSLLVTAVNSPTTDGCIVTLDGSQDGTHYWVLAAIQLNSSVTSSVVVNGYFPLLRLTFNFNSATCLTGQVTGSYIGYQYPLPPVGNNTGQHIVQNNITGPIVLFPTFGFDLTPWQMSSL